MTKSIRQAPKQSLALFSKGLKMLNDWRWIESDAVVAAQGGPGGQNRMAAKWIEIGA